MLEFIGWCLLAVLAGDYGKYYKKTGDASIEGFLEYLKDKYYTKHTDTSANTGQKKYEPKPGSNAHYEAWKTERMKNQNQTR